MFLLHEVTHYQIAVGTGGSGAAAGIQVSLT
jgi:hypothetical protein